MTEDRRAVARRYAAESIADGDDTAWFERLYADTERGEAIVPWADDAPNPLLVGQVAPGDGRRALVVGCGYGDDAAYLASLGWSVTAFDVSPTAVEAARRRHDGVAFVVADLLDLPEDWSEAFDLVVEIYTVQTLTGEARRTAIGAIRALVAPGGTLLVIARARDEDDPSGHMPWPLTRAEVDALAPPTADAAVEDLYDGETPPVRRWRARFTRAAS